MDENLGLAAGNISFLWGPGAANGRTSPGGTHCSYTTACIIHFFFRVGAFQSLIRTLKGQLSKHQPRASFVLGAPLPFYHKNEA